MELKQFDTNLDRFHYVIEESGIRLIKKGLASGSDTFVDFEDVGSKIIRENSRKLIWLCLSVLFIIIAGAVFANRLMGGKVGSGAELFHLTLSLVFFAVYLLTKKNVLYLAEADNTNAIEFIASKRYKQQVDEFIKILLQKRNEYLLGKYSQIDEHLPYNQQYNNLVWLYNLKLFTKAALKEKIEALDQLETKLSSSKTNLTEIKGFRRTESDDDDDEP